MPFAREEREREPALAPGKLPLFDQCFLVFDEDSAGQIDTQGRQGFANLQARFRK